MRKPSFGKVANGGGSQTLASPLVQSAVRQVCDRLLHPQGQSLHIIKQSLPDNVTANRAD